ncbi:AMP-binding protein [Paenibacillus larvae]|nr:AMP-binding protein [Paenibacillus larvae]
MTSPITDGAGSGKSHVVRSPVQNTTIYIVDEAGELCPVGVKGEIWVAGIGVGRGYLNQEEKTREAFTEDPFAKEPGVRLYKTGDIGRLEDGNIEFLGRKDDQVKIRGYRIEIGEVENRLSEIAGIKEAVVTVRGGEDREVPVCLCNGGREDRHGEGEAGAWQKPAGLHGTGVCGGDGTAAADEERKK